MAEAEAIGPLLKTLDASHAASLIRSGLPETLVTHDSTMTRAADELGYPVA